MAAKISFKKNRSTPNLSIPLRPQQPRGRQSHQVPGPRLGVQLPDSIELFSKDVHGIVSHRRGANVNAANRKGDTPLMVAAASPGYGDKTEMMRVLLASGADPRASDREGHTALSLAKQGGSVNVVNLLENALAKYR